MLSTSLSRKDESGMEPHGKQIGRALLTLLKCRDAFLEQHSFLPLIQKVAVASVEVTGENFYVPSLILQSKKGVDPFFSITEVRWLGNRPGYGLWEGRGAKIASLWQQMTTPPPLAPWQPILLHLSLLPGVQSVPMYWGHGLCQKLSFFCFPFNMEEICCLTWLNLSGTFYKNKPIAGKDLTASYLSLAQLTVHQRDCLFSFS